MIPRIETTVVNIYSLAPMRELLLAASRRYLEFISAIEDDRAGTNKLNKISRPVEENDPSNRGSNFFDPEDEELFEALGNGEFNTSGFPNKDPRRRVKSLSDSRTFSGPCPLKVLPDSVKIL